MINNINIEDFRVKKSISFYLHKGKLKTDFITSLLYSRALYCVVTDDEKIIRIIGDELKTDDLNIEIDGYGQFATIKGYESIVDDFEGNFVQHIAAEKLWRNLAFSKIPTKEEKFQYFIFLPVKAILNRNDNIQYLLYPVLKRNSKQVIVEFYYFPNEDSLSIEEFEKFIIQTGDTFRKLTLPIGYYEALGYKIDKSKIISNTQDSLVIDYYNSEELKTDSLFDLSENLVSLIYDFEEYTYFGRNLISIDNKNIPKQDIINLKNGISRNWQNPILNKELKNFSESENYELYVFEHTTITLGDIYESYIVSSVIDEEIIILNTNLYALNFEPYTQNMEELLDTKEELLQIKIRISNKYSNFAFVYYLMDYALGELFHIEDRIKLLNETIEVKLQKSEYSKNNNRYTFGIIISLFSIFSLAAILQTNLINPLLTIKSKYYLSKIDNILNYIMILFSIGILYLVIYMIVRNWKSIMSHKSKR